MQLHGGIERQNGGLGDTLTWEKSSDKKVQEAQSKMMMIIHKMMIHDDDQLNAETRARSEKMRSEVEHQLATAATAMLR